jgi:hypothetical protein
VFGISDTVTSSPCDGESPWQAPDFCRLFTASVASQVATSIGYVAVPLFAVLALHAGAGQVGALATLSTVAFLLIGLPAGSWVDRLQARSVLAAADFVRAGLFASVPVAQLFGALTFWQLYVVVLSAGCATVFFDVGSQSAIPRFVPRGALLQANGAVAGLIAACNVAGRGAGGAFVQLLGAPVALGVAAANYLVSALRLRALTRDATVPAAAGVRIWPQIAAGLRHVFGDAELRALALTAAISNFGMQIVNTMLPVVFTRELALPGGALGAFWAAGAAGVLLGARCARRLAGALGLGRTLTRLGPCLAPCALGVAHIERGPWLWLAAGGWLLAMFKIGVDNVLGVSLRQQATPAPLLGRMTATFRFVLTGALAIGSAASGVIGELAGVRAALWMGASVLAVAFVPVTISPLRHASGY